LTLDYPGVAAVIVTLPCVASIVEPIGTLRNDDSGTNRLVPGSRTST